MKVALLCDVDQTVYHVGDEAIASASARRLRERGHEVLRISRLEKFGPAGERPDPSFPALVFPWELERRAAYLGEIRRVLDGDAGALPRGDKLHAFVDRLREADALVIGGGGALTSRYGWLLDERLATALVARSLGLPVVLSGQSLGPELTPQDRDRIRELLDMCTLVGLRDAHSARLARQIAPEHPAILHTLDDAIGLVPVDGSDPDGPAGPAGSVGPAGAEGSAPGDGIGALSVTLGADGDPFPREDYVRVLAAVVDGLAARTGADVELLPHMADPDTGGADLAIHDELAARLTAPARVLPIETDTAAVARTQRAAWVVSTRFHPVVLGALGGAGVLALPLNRYGASRMDGALANMGIGGGTVPLAALWDPAARAPSTLLEPVLDALVAGREAERERLVAARGPVLAAAEEWWDRIDAVLRGVEDAAGLPDPRGAGLPREARWPAELEAPLAPFVPPLHRGRPRTATPEVSIIMRTQRRPLMLDRAVQDVLGQSRQDWELLVVDDAGDAAAVDAVLDRHREEAAGRLAVVHRTASEGMEAASNAGLTATSAPLVAVHDDDDTWHPTFLQETTAHLAEHPARDAVVVRTLVVHEHETDAGFVEDGVHVSWPEVTGVRLVDYLEINRHTPIAMLHRRAIHEAVGLFDESLPVVGDYAFHLALLERAEVGFLERPLAHWRQRPRATGSGGNSITTRRDEHVAFDAVLRERHLRSWTRDHGLGLPLYLTHSTGTMLQRSEDRLVEELHSLHEELRATREELAEVREKVARLDALSLGARAVRRLRGRRER